MTLKQRIALGLILALALLVRFGLVLHVGHHRPEGIMVPDSHTYEIPALSLLREGRFLNALGQPDIVRTPGYPLLIAAIYGVAGIEPVNVIMVQAMLSIVTVGLLFLIARPRWGTGVGLLAALLLVIDAATTGHIMYMLTETWFTLLLVLMIWVGLSIIEQRPATGASRTAAEPTAGERGQAWGIFLFGLLLAAATHVRPLAYYLVAPLLAGLALVLWRRGLPWRTIAARCALMLAPWIVLVGGWQLRNKIELDRFALSMVEKGHMMFYKAMELAAQDQGISVDEAILQFRATLPDLSALSPEQARQFEIEQSKVVFRRHLGRFALNTLKSGLKLYQPSSGGLLNPVGLSAALRGDLYQDYQRLPWRDFVRKWWAFPLIMASVASLCLVYLGAAILWLSLARHYRATDWPAELFLLGIVLYFTALTALSGWGYDRFRVPLMPILMLWGARGLAIAWRAAGDLRARLASPQRAGQE